MGIPELKSTKLRDLLVTCSDIFDRNERFSMSDSVIAAAISKFSGNDSLESVLPKIIIINSFYATQIYDTAKMARHIINTDADRRLAAGDLSLSDDIRHGHEIRSKKSSKEIDFYSFATKYTAVHQPVKFPIFDSLVMRLLTALNRQLGFCSRFTQSDLRDYQRYVSVIDALIEFTGLVSFKYKKLDQGLWVYAKYLYAPVNLTGLSEKRLKTSACRLIELGRPLC